MKNIDHKHVSEVKHLAYDDFEASYILDSLMTGFADNAEFDIHSLAVDPMWSERDAPFSSYYMDVHKF